MEREVTGFRVGTRTSEAFWRVASGVAEVGGIGSRIRVGDSVWGAYRIFNLEMGFLVLLRPCLLYIPIENRFSGSSRPK